MDMESKGAVTNARYGPVAIYILFNKVGEIAPIKDRTPEAMIDGLKEYLPQCENQSNYIQMKKVRCGLQK